MTYKPNDLPAFPVAGTEANFPNEGMTLLDYFAGQALAGILAGGWADTVPHDDMDHSNHLAFFAYKDARAMLAEREK